MVQLKTLLKWDTHRGKVGRCVDVGWGEVEVELRRCRTTARQDKPINSIKVLALVFTFKIGLSIDKRRSSQTVAVSETMFSTGSLNIAAKKWLPESRDLMPKEKRGKRDTFRSGPRCR